VRLEDLRTHRVHAVAVAAALATVLVSALALPPAAHAVVETAGGVACSIVGTMGHDVLSGTPGRDVICGLGGNDVINGRGGNDLIEGGAGDDSLTGGLGNDVIYGGAGRDSLVGGAGDDRLDGGLDNDGLWGNDGADVLRGGPGHEEIYGGPGNDRINGGDGRDAVMGQGGNDAVSGVGGNDDLRGGTGADRIYGGDGADHEAGDDGNDVVSGNLGDDTLSGGLGADVVDGGPGFNVCDAPSAITDTQFRCVIDMSNPVVGGVTVSPTTVDVSSEPQTIQSEAHVTDDTGVASVQIGDRMASLISGTPRDGTWATTIRVPRFISPGPRDIYVGVRDRVGRATSETFSSVFTVVNTVYDKEMPVLQSLSLNTSSVDVRTGAKQITATVHVTDDLAGAADVTLCPAHAFATGTPSFRMDVGCLGMSKTSGTRTDSTWEGTIIIPEGAPGGTWNVAVLITDAAGNFANDFWFGPDELAALGTTNEPRYKAIPDGAGMFTVLGSTPDSHAPVLTSLTLAPSTIDTSHGAVLVTADIAGTDVEGITDAELIISGYAGYPNNPTDNVQIAWVQDFQRISGTAQNGVWRATFVVAGGTPDGTYFIQAILGDSANWESWVSSDSGWTTNNHVLDDTLAPTGTHFVVANST
jgi:Ca2+-binding RTX toxin-like protein